MFQRYIVEVMGVGAPSHSTMLTSTLKMIVGLTATNSGRVAMTITYQSAYEAFTLTSIGSSVVGVVVTPVVGIVARLSSRSLCNSSSNGI